MNSINLRKRTRVSYYEPDEPALDEYIYCEKCKDFVYEYCSIHGPLLVIPDDKVSEKTNLPSFVPRAALTIPHTFLHLARSYIPGAGLGVFSTLTLPRGVRFGPYEGKFSKEATSSYCWQLYDGNNRPTHVVDAADAGISNWMRYVNCARYWDEQNLVAYQYQGQLYYRTMKIIPRFSELLVFYGSEFAHSLNIDVKLYNSSAGCAQKLAEQLHITSLQDTTSSPPQLKRLKFEATSEELQSESVQDLPIIQDQISTETLSKDVPNTHTESETKENQIIYTPSTEHTPKIMQNDVIHIENVFICDTCDKQFDDKLKLIEHIHYHSQVIPKLYLRCEECSYKCIYSNDFEKHKLLHDKSRPHACHICKRRYREKRDFNRHLKTHENKTEVCPVCLQNNKYNAVRNLKRHLKSHGEQKNYQCNLCPRKFILESALALHLNTHCDMKPHICPLCQKSFKLKHSVSRHIKRYCSKLRS